MISRKDFCSNGNFSFYIFDSPSIRFDSQRVECVFWRRHCTGTSRLYHHNHHQSFAIHQSATVVKVLQSSSAITNGLHVVRHHVKSKENCLPPVTTANNASSKSNFYPALEKPKSLASAYLSMKRMNRSHSAGLCITIIDSMDCGLPLTNRAFTSLVVISPSSSLGYEEKKT